MIDEHPDNMKCGFRIERISGELNTLSALYSAKCQENSKLDEEMQNLLRDREEKCANTG